MSEEPDVEAGREPSVAETDLDPPGPAAQPASSATETRAASSREQRRVGMGAALLLAAAAGTLLAASFPPWSLWVLAWIGLAPLVVALQGSTLRRGALLGWAAGAA